MRTLLGLALLLSAAPARSTAAGPIDDLLGWVPPRANVALMIDAEALNRSDIATANRWGSPDIPTTGLDSLPADASRLVVASQFGPGAGPTWQVAVLSLKKAVAEDDFLRRTDGTRETLNGRPVFLTPRHGYVANLAPRVAGAFQPANRPEAGRWLREATGKVPDGLSPYIREASERVGVLSQVVLAIDTSDMFDFGQVKGKLQNAESLKGAKAAAATDIGNLAALFTGLKGMTLKIRATDKLAAELRLDFAKSAEPLAAVGKPLLLEALDRMGLPADEMAGWAFAVKGEAVTFSGQLSPDAADQLLAPLLGPGVSAADTTESLSAAGPDAKAKASLKYFKAVERVSDDCRNGKSSTYSQLAFRFNNGARRIDDLPILNVDDELLDWGAAMATTFRSMGIVVQSTSGAISMNEANRSMSMVTTPNYYYGSSYAGGVGYWGAYGGGSAWAVPNGAVSTSVVDNYGQINNMNAMTKGKEMEYRMKTWDAVKSATTDIRRKMVKKFGIEF